MKSYIPGVVLELEEVVEAGDALLRAWPFTAIVPTLRVAGALCKKTQTDELSSESFHRYPVMHNIIRKKHLPTYSSLYSSSDGVSATERVLSLRNEYGCMEVP